MREELDADMGTQVSAHEGPMHHRGYNMNAPCHNVKSQSRHTNDTDKPPKGDRRLGGGKGFHGSILKTFTKHSRSIHKTLTKHSQSIHSVFTKHSQSTRKTLTKHSQRIRKTLTKHSQSIHKAFTKHSQRTHKALTMHSQSTHKALTKRTHKAYSQCTHKALTMHLQKHSQLSRAERSDFFYTTSASPPA